MGSQDGVGMARSDEGAEKGITYLASSLFESFSVFGGSGRNVSTMDVEREVELDAKILDEGQVCVGLHGCSDAVMDMDGGEANPEGIALGGVGLVECEK
jgi:hypothetical protein